MKVRKIGPLHVSVDWVAVKRALACMARDTTRAVLQSVYLEIDKDGATLTSTDGRRLTTFRLRAIRKPVPRMLLKKSYIICYEGKPHLHPLALLMRDKKRTEIEITVSPPGQDNVCWVHFANGEQTVSTKVLDAIYPNYKHLLPKQLPRFTEVDQKEMMAALKALKPFAPPRRDQPTVDMTFTANGVTLYVDTRRGLSKIVQITAKHWRGNNAKMDTITLSLDYLIDCVTQKPGALYFEYENPFSVVAIGTTLAGDIIDRRDVTLLMPLNKW